MANATAQKSTKQTQARPRSFLVGTQAVMEGGDYDQTVTADTNSHNLQPWTLQATGWLRGLWLVVTGTGLTAGTVTADGPAAIFQNIELDDVNNEAIFGPFDGYTARLTNKYGGYIFAGDPYTNATFAYSGTTTTNNFTFCLYIPLEIVSRDPLGPVASVNNTASLTLRATIAPVSAVFTAVTGTLSVHVQGTQSFYWEPKKADNQGRQIMGEPPASGTTQYWTQGSVPIAGAGTINQQLITGLGYPFRSYAFVLRDTTGARNEANFPNPLIGLKFEANMLLSNYSKTLWRQQMAAKYGYNGALDATGAGTIPGGDSGVFMLNWNDDFFMQKPGGETRRSYLITSPGSNFIINGAFGGAGNLYSVVNYVAPGGGAAGRQNTAALTGGQ
jgi:hypothetical protein